MNDIGTLLTYLGYFLLITNTILYSIGFFRNGKAYCLLVAYLWLMVVVQVIAYIVMINGHNNLYLSHFYFIGQFVILNRLYHLLLSHSHQKKIANLIVVSGIVLIVGQYIWNPTLLLQFNMFEVFLTSLLTIIVAILALYNMLTEKKQFYFVTIGVVFYLFSSTVIFLVGNLTIKLGNHYKLMPWLLNAVFIIVYQLFILYEWKVSFLDKKI